MTEHTFFTLGEAAKVAGKSKATISNAIKSGRLSVHEKETGRYRIAASELFRVFPLNSSINATIERSLTPENERLNGPLDREIERRDERITALEREMHERLSDKDSVIEDLRRRLDTESEERRKLTALLTDRREKGPQEAPGGRWARAWSILRGKG